MNNLICCFVGTLTIGKCFNCVYYLKVCGSILQATWHSIDIWSFQQRASLPIFNIYYVLVTVYTYILSFNSHSSCVSQVLWKWLEMKELALAEIGVASQNRPSNLVFFKRGGMADVLENSIREPIIQLQFFMTNLVSFTCPLFGSSSDIFHL